MKSLITLLFILTSAVSALANTNDHDKVLNPQIESYVQVEFSKMGDLLDSSTIVAAELNEVKTATETEVARLYKFKNSRIKKALAFKTKRNRAKTA
ncbi:hypothetical protein FEE95_19905 [Maribacter algarum]|uniref:Uncharacterized protein n=1 Tax=Maribacter algarum (ex Zhang et al. 2020) TaxID=2578118 RepID=A0A5S3PJ09_9FLAO|nr:hypothetical protein [Maribacter algarum]TMM53329.1 hypothetical protein FEE95_19905 [Maribacter algarum]